MKGLWAVIVEQGYSDRCTEGQVAFMQLYVGVPELSALSCVHWRRRYNRSHGLVDLTRMLPQQHAHALQAQGHQVNQAFCCPVLNLLLKWAGLFDP